MPTPNYPSDSITENLITQIQNLGGTPTSFGLGELQRLLASLQGGGGGGAVSSVSAADSSTVVTPTTGAVTISRGALTGDTTASAGSGVTTLVGTTNVEDIIRLQTPNQLNPPSAAVPWNNQRLTNIAAPLLSTDAPTALNALLGSTYYEPATQQLKSTSSTSLVAVDTTNLTLSFTAISSIAVIELEAFVGIFAGTTASQLFWALFTHSTTTQVGYTTTALDVAAANISPRIRATIRITGLSAGTAYQVDWAWGSASALDTWTMIIQCTTGAAGGGPAIMRAFAG